MAKFVAIYGVLMLTAAIASGILAGIKRRDWNYWAAVSFLFPPAFIMLILMPKNTGPRPTSRRDDALYHDHND